MEFIMLIVGLFLGWNVEQPGYAKTLQAWAMKKYREFRNPNKDDVTPTE